MISPIESELRAGCREGFYSTWARHIASRPKRSPWTWAHDERFIGQGASPLSQEGAIRYDGSRMPYCQEPTETAVDAEVQITVLWWAAAMGKTDGVVTNIHGWGMTEQPTNIMVAFPIEPQRDKYSRDVIQAGLIDATPAIRSLVVQKKSRETGNTIAYKKFPGGSLNMVAARSVSSFRGPRVGIMHCAEVDAMPGSVGVEGDPVLLAFKRCEGFARAVKIVEGTGTLAPTTGEGGEKIYRSRIQYWYEMSDQRKWFCPCRRCGHLQFLVWGQIRHPAGKPWLGEYFCIKCDAGHNDKQRVGIVMDGKWLPTAPFDGIRGYWLNGINSVLPAEKGFRNKIHQFIKDAERADRGMDPQFSRRQWKNTFLAEVDDPEGETEKPPDWKPLHARREDYASDDGITVPAGALVITAAVDVHKDRLEVEWEALGRREEVWGLDHSVLYGEVQDDAVWKELERELKREFRHALGCSIGISVGFVDAGRWPEWVYRFFRRLAERGSPLGGKVRACRGSSTNPHPILDHHFGSIAKNLKGHWIGTNAAKELVYRRLRLVPNEDGSLPEGWRHFPQRYGEVYFEQLTSETVTVAFEKGEEVRKYLNSHHVRNEALDLAVYNLAAQRRRRWDFDSIEAELRERAEEAKGVKQQPAPVKSRMRRTEGFI